jgi:ClpP class serine protease
MPMSLFDLACQQKWAITEDGLRAILALVNREALDPDLARQIREDRATRPSALAAQAGRPLDGARGARVRDSVAIIEVVGPIVRRADMFSDISGATSAEWLARDLTVALKDTMVEAILLAVDSPGGEVTGINELAQMVFAARSQKPIWAYVEGLGASAAYWVASAAEQIIIDPTADLGSIGVVMAVPDPAKRSSKDIEIVSSQSPNKRPDVTSERGRQLLQTIVDDTAAVFISAVARNRNTTDETVLREYGQGGVMVGRVAVAAGLADRLGSFEATLADIRQVAIQRKQQQRSRLAATEDERMKVSDMWRGFFKAAKDEGIEIEPEETEVVTTAQATPAQAQSADTRDAELQALRERIAKQEAQQIQVAAAAFADGAIRDRRAMPAERDTLVRLYTAAAQDDARNPWPVPTDAGEAPSRVALLEADIATRPQHTLLQERVSVGQGGVLETGTKPEGLSEERRRQLLAMSPTGQAVLKARRATSA